MESSTKELSWNDVYDVVKQLRDKYQGAYQDFIIIDQALSKIEKEIEDVSKTLTKDS